MQTKRKHEGYLLIDNRHAPGVTPEQAAAFGKPVAGLGEKFFESAVVTCSHCHVQVVLNPDRERSRGYCRKCDHYVCDNPACNSDCVPLRKVMDETRERLILNQSKGLT